MSGLGPVLVTATEELYRQVNPNFVQGATLSTQVFKPTQADNGLLSVSRSSKTSAKVAFERFLACGRKSVGVIAVTVAQVEAQGLKAHEDKDVPTDDTHALIDFNGKTEDEARRARTQLTLLAQGRWHHRPAA